jgi:hypothetical protein
MGQNSSANVSKKTILFVPKLYNLVKNEQSGYISRNFFPFFYKSGRCAVENSLCKKGFAGVLDVEFNGESENDEFDL